MCLDFIFTDLLRMHTRMHVCIQTISAHEKIVTLILDIKNESGYHLYSALFIPSVYSILHTQGVSVANVILQASVWFMV